MPSVETELIDLCFQLEFIKLKLLACFLSLNKFEGLHKSNRTATKTACFSLACVFLNYSATCLQRLAFAL